MENTVFEIIITFKEFRGNFKNQFGVNRMVSSFIYLYRPIHQNISSARYIKRWLRKFYEDYTVEQKQKDFRQN